MVKEIDRKRFFSEITKIPRAFLVPFFFGKRRVFMKPNFISLEMEDRCCLRCLHCDIWKKQKNCSRLTFGQIKKIILDLKKWLSFYQLNLAGGEPLMNPNTIRTIKFASRNGIFVHANTNGFLVDKKKARELIESGIGSISLSLDNLIEADHDATRGRSGVYKNIMRGIDYLLDFRKKAQNPPFISLTTIILKKNIHKLTKLVEFTAKKGIDTIYFQPIWHNFGASSYDRLWFKKSKLWPDDFKEVSAALNRLIEMKKNGSPIGNSMYELKEYKQYFRNPLLYARNKSCYVGINSFNIGIDGKVRLCFDFPAIGDLLKDSPEKVWNNYMAGNLRKRIAECQRGCKVLLCNMPLSKREASNFLFKITFDRIMKLSASFYPSTRKSRLLVRQAHHPEYSRRTSGDEW